MSTFSDIHHQTWMAFHRAMLSDIPMSVLHPGFPPVVPHVEDRGLSSDSLGPLRIDPWAEASMEWEREDEAYWEACMNDYQELVDEYDDWPVPTYPEPTDEEMDEWEERNRRRIAEQNEY